MGGLDRIRHWARVVKMDAVALYLATRDPRTPWYAKLLAGVVVAYALSPIDLIPDFIPVLGYLDDFLLVPLGLWLAVRLIPAEVMKDCRTRGAELAERPVSRTAAVVVVAIWLGALAVVVRLVYRSIHAG